MRFVLVALAMLQAGCSALSAPPSDQYYRLSVGPTDTGAVSHERVAVAPFFASGLHGERALIYAHADGTALEQYNYHYWIDSPRYLLQQALADTLKRHLGVDTVEAPVAGTSWTIMGRIVQFERVAGADGGSAIVAVQFDVYGDGHELPAFSRRYEQAEALAEDSVEAAVRALDAGSATLMNRFVTDFDTLRKTRQ